MEIPQSEKDQNNTGYQDITLITVATALLIPPIMGYFIVLLFTSLFEAIGREIWSTVPIIWPDILFFGGIFGGLIGGIIALIEIILYHYQNRNTMPGKIFSPDLYYTGGLMVFTYVLEFISESQILQAILFLLEILFFIVIGWNISKMLLETNIVSKDDTTTKSTILPIDNDQIDSVEVE